MRDDNNRLRTRSIHVAQRVVAGIAVRISQHREDRIRLQVPGLGLGARKLLNPQQRMRSQPSSCLNRTAVKYYGQLERQNREHRAWLKQAENELDPLLHVVNRVWRRGRLGWKTAAELWNARAPVVEDRAKLREEVDERAARIRHELESRGENAAQAERFAIEAALQNRGYLRRKVGGWCWWKSRRFRLINRGAAQGIAVRERKVFKRGLALVMLVLASCASPRADHSTHSSFSPEPTPTLRAIRLRACRSTGIEADGKAIWRNGPIRSHSALVNEEEVGGVPLCLLFFQDGVVGADSRKTSDFLSWDSFHVERGVLVPIGHASLQLGQLDTSDGRQVSIVARGSYCKSRNGSACVNKQNSKNLRVTYECEDVETVDGPFQHYDCIPSESGIP